MRKSIAVSLGLALMLAAAVPAPAAVVFNNFGVGDSYDSVNSYTVGLTVGSAAAFISSGAYTLDAIEVGMLHNAGPNELDIMLATDSGGAPGTILETIHLSNAVPPAPGPAAPVLASSVLHPLLSAATQYWVIAAAPGDSLLGWYRNNIGDIGVNAQNVGAGPWVPLTDVRLAMRVTGTAVAAIPEPSTYALMLAGLVIVAAAARRRKSAVSA